MLRIKSRCETELWHLSQWVRLQISWQSPTLNLSEKALNHQRGAHAEQFSVLVEQTHVYLPVRPCSALLITFREISQSPSTRPSLNSINYRQGRSAARQPYLQPRKQLEVNNEAWLAQFMGCCKIATMIKISVRWKTMVQLFFSRLRWNIFTLPSSSSCLSSPMTSFAGFG